MPTKTRTITALAALSLALAACGDDDRGAATADAAARFVDRTDGLYINDQAAQQRLADKGFVSATTRMHAGARITVLRFRDARSAKAEASRLLADAYQTPRGALSCDLHKQTLNVAGVPGASGAVVDTRSATGQPTKLARIVFSKGRFTFHLSAQAKAGSLPVAQLQHAATRAFVG